MDILNELNQRESSPREDEHGQLLVYETISDAMEGTFSPECDEIEDYEMGIDAHTEEFYLRFSMFTDYWKPTEKILKRLAEVLRPMATVVVYVSGDIKRLVIERHCFRMEKIPTVKRSHWDMDGEESEDEGHQ